MDHDSFLEVKAGKPALALPPWLEDSVATPVPEPASSDAPPEQAPTEGDPDLRDLQRGLAELQVAHDEHAHGPPIPLV